MNITPIETPPIIPLDPWAALPKAIQDKILDDHRYDDLTSNECIIERVREEIIDLSEYINQEADEDE
jgi:hypothetical protein